MIKIFYNNKTILVSKENILNNILFDTKVNIFDENQVKTQLNLFLTTSQITILLLYGADEDCILQKLEKHFVLIKAAGGIILNLNKEVLCIERLGYFDFPKGKIEIGESERTAALREVQEECGILPSELNIISSAYYTYHIYMIHNTYVLKKTYWFLMRYNGNNNFSPQIEEGITNVNWIKLSEINYFIINTYLSLKELMQFLLEKKIL